MGEFGFAGMTAHKAQGSTIPFVLVDLGHLVADSAALAYVALTRPRTLANLYVARLHPGVISCDVGAIVESNAIRAGLGLPQVATFNAPSAKHPLARRLVHKHLPRNDTLTILSSGFNKPPRTDRTPLKKRGKTTKQPKTPRKSKSAKKAQNSKQRGEGQSRRVLALAGKKADGTEQNSLRECPLRPEPRAKVARREEVLRPSDNNTYVRLLWASNGCYFNSAMQMLYSIPDLMDSIQAANELEPYSHICAELEKIWQGRNEAQHSMRARRAFAEDIELDQPVLADGIRGSEMETPSTVLSFLLQHGNEEVMPLLPPSITERFRTATTRSEMRCRLCPQDFWHETENTNFVNMRLRISGVRNNWKDILFGTPDEPLEIPGEDIERKCNFGCLNANHPDGYTKHEIRDFFWLESGNEQKNLVLVELPILVATGAGNIRLRRRITGFEGFIINGVRHRVLAAVEAPSDAHYVAYSALRDRSGFLRIDDLQEKNGNGAQFVKSLPTSLAAITSLLLQPDDQSEEAERLNSLRGAEIPELELENRRISFNTRINRNSLAQMCFGYCQNLKQSHQDVLDTIGAERVPP